uniref:Uncharacterized protein n=1 Tax=Helianthus annuus TaxID=4232 RepID=A0A251SPD6_HELAN
MATYENFHKVKEDDLREFKATHFNINRDNRELRICLNFFSIFAYTLSRQLSYSL